MTPAIIRRTSQAAPVCAAVETGLALETLGAFFRRMMAKVMRARRTAHVKKSSTKPTQSQVPMPGMWKYLLNRSP